jgi:hypothetical protein
MTEFKLTILNRLLSRLRFSAGVLPFVLDGLSRVSQQRTTHLRTHVNRKVTLKMTAVFSFVTLESFQYMSHKTKRIPPTAHNLFLKLSHKFDKLFVTSYLHRDVDETYRLLGCYAAPGVKFYRSFGTKYQSPIQVSRTPIPLGLLDL